jgi:probable F420-dependent oxidoreductase
VKVRIGFGLGVRTRYHDERLGVLVDALERLRFDSLWLSERIGSDAPDPVVGMAYAAGRTTKLKFGTSVLVLPGRNPALLAKELATLDQLSGGRLLPAFGLGAVDAHEQQAFGVERGDRAHWFDEALPLVRRFWTEDAVTHHGDRFHYDEVRVLPKPRQSPPDVWLGGLAPSELKRVGRLGDGWLPSFVTPADVERGRVAVEEAAARHERTMDPEHWGVLVPYAMHQVPEVFVTAMARRRPDLADPSVLVPVGFEALGKDLQRFVDVGFSKFVVIPLEEPAGERIEDHLADLGSAVLGMQTR